MRYVHCFFFVLLLTSITSCADPNDARREFLQTEMKRLENDYTLASQELARQQGHINFLQQELQQKRSELSDYNRQFEAYLMNHKMAVAALAAGVGGTAIAYDPNNEFSDDVQVISGIVGAVAVLYALGNLEEVSEVADRIMQADRYVEVLETRLDEIQSELQAASKPLADLQKNLNSIQQTYDSYKNELVSLE